VKIITPGTSKKKPILNVKINFKDTIWAKNQSRNSKSNQIYCDQEKFQNKNG
jgi:hypothetical protein